MSRRHPPPPIDKALAAHILARMGEVGQPPDKYVPAYLVKRDEEDVSGCHGTGLAVMGQFRLRSNPVSGRWATIIRQRQ